MLVNLITNTCFSYENRYYCGSGIHISVYEQSNFKTKPIRFLIVNVKNISLHFIIFQHVLVCDSNFAFEFYFSSRFSDSLYSLFVAVLVDNFQRTLTAAEAQRKEKSKHRTLFVSVRKLFHFKVALVLKTTKVIWERLYMIFLFRKIGFRATFWFCIVILCYCLWHSLV